MKERPILMSAPMVRAILAGTKTQTRRVVKPQPANLRIGGACSYDEHGQWVWLDGRDGSIVSRVGRCPYGIPGDRLRVKEAAWMWCERRPNGKTPAGRDKWLYVPMREAGLFYAADHPQRPAISVVSPDTGNQWGWRLKIGRFLPAWASRILLEVTDVRVERLQDISEADAVAEGCQPRQPLTASGIVIPGQWRLGYRDLWGQINGPGSWDANPWVWCVSFKRISSEGVTE